MKIKRIWGWIGLSVLIPVVAFFTFLDKSYLFFTLLTVAITLVILPYCFDLIVKTPKQQVNPKEAIEKAREVFE